MITEQNIIQILVIVVLSYLLGSFPTAYLVAKLHNINIFEVGSGNMGGTNAARALGLSWGLVVSGVDIVKGIAAIVVARLILPDELWLATTVSGIVVIIGHNWSLFATMIYMAANKGSRLTIRGGKGAATAFGTLLMIAPVTTILGMLTLGVSLVIITRYVSLGVLSAFGVAIAWLLVLAAQQDTNIMPYAPYAILLAFLLILRFRGNIQRLLAGKERRLGERV